MIERPTLCAGCPGHPRTAGYNANLWGAFVPPAGPRDADLLMIGIAPGEVEEMQGEPLVGPAGKKVHLAIDWAREAQGIKIRKLNIVNCRTRKRGATQTWVNRDPTIREFRECAERFLLPELRKTKAKVVLLLGQLPFDFLLQPKGIIYWGLPVRRHKYTYALCMGHRNRLPRGLF